MRRTAARVLALLPPAALALACGSSPTESVGTSSEAIIPVTCPVGEHSYCDTNELTGKLFCTCVQNTCSYATPAPPSPDGNLVWIAAWASPMLEGTCPVITTATGRWAEIGDVIGPTGADYAESVPTDTSWSPLAASDCTQVPGMGSSCCFYVWWPDGYPSSQDAALPTQDTLDLCPVNGATLVPIEQGPCNNTGGHKCPQPGSGGCGSCIQVEGP